MDQLVRLDNRTEGRSFFHLDGLRSTVSLTDAAGGSRQSIFYDAWGNERDRIGASANNFTFTGHELDEETGLIYAKARFYDPEIGRFLAQDSMLGNPANAPSLHRYAYTENRPTIFTDPTGRITAKGFARGLFGVVAEPFAEILDIGIVTYAQQEGLDVGRVPLYSSLGRAQRSRLLEGQGTASTSLSGTADVAYAVGTFGIGPFIEGHIQLAQAVAAGEITIDEYDEGVSQLAGGATAVAVLASIAESSSGRGWRGNQTGRSAQQPSISEGEPTGKIITEKAGTDAQPSAEPAKTTRSAAEQLRLNKAQADAFEGELGEVLRQRQADVQEQVSIKPNTEEGPASFRFRPDFLGKEGGEIVVTEGKSSETAPLTPRQAEGIPLLEEYGGTVVGKKGGDAFPAGTVLPPGTKVNIVRPADVLVLRGFKPPLALSPPRKCDENGLCSP
jgi:RHS repeat-associated protein